MPHTTFKETATGENTRIKRTTNRWPLAVKKKPFDLAAFKRYVKTYSESDAAGDEDIFVKDMLYGIGLALDPEKNSMHSGYKKFTDYLKTHIL